MTQDAAPRTSGGPGGRLRAPAVVGAVMIFMVVIGASAAAYALTRGPASPADVSTVTTLPASPAAVP